MTDIKISVGGKDEGAKALLEALTRGIQTLSAERAKGLGITIREKSETEKLAEAQRRSASAIRAAARGHAASIVASREAATAASQAAKATDRQTRAAVRAATETNRAIANQTAIQVKAYNDAVAASVRAITATNKETQAHITAASTIVTQLNEQSRAQRQATAVAIKASADQVTASNKATTAQLVNTRKITRAMSEQNRVQLELSRTARQAANDAANASRAAAAGVKAAATTSAARTRAASQITVARIGRDETTTRGQFAVQVENLRLQRQALRGQQALAVAQLQGAQASKQAAAGNTLLGGSFRKLLLAGAGAVAFRNFVREGTQFNQTLETATLGIASLITAQAKLYDSNGTLITGTQALNVAMDLSERQMTKLRIAGLQTAATTEQLVTAMQQGVGPGLRAGLGLDEIRQLTISITQAAGAVGLPMHQLNEEVRSLLAGTITYNTRIAKTLGITNAMVSDWKQQGTLAENLQRRFDAFNVAGARAMENAAVLKSNLAEAFQVFAGDATRPFFDALKKNGLAALNSLFDFDRGTISAAFQGIVDVARAIFGSLGGLLSRAIQSGLATVQRLSVYFDENREKVEGVITSAEELVRQMGRVAGVVVSTLAGLIDMGIQSGFIEGLFRSIAQILQVVADNVFIIRDVLAAGIIFKGITAILALATAGPVAAGILTIVGALGLLGLAMAGTVSEAERLDRQRALDEEANRNRAVAIHELATEYDLLAARVAANTEPADKLYVAQQRMKKIQDELKRLSPGFRTEIERQGHSYQATREQVQALGRAQLQQIRIQFETSRARQQALQEQVRLERQLLATNQQSLTTAKARGEDKSFIKNREKAVKNSQQALSELETRMGQARADVEASINAAAVAIGNEDALRKPPTIKPQVGDDEDEQSKKTNNDLKQIIDARIAEVKDALAYAREELDYALSQQQISFTDYVNGILAAQENALTQEFNLRLALLNATQDPGEQAKIKQEMRSIVEERKGLEKEASRRLIALRKDYNDEILQLDIQRLRNEGKVAEARRLEVTAQYAELRRTIVANKGDTRAVDKLIDVEVIKSQAEEVETVIGRAQARMASRLKEIEALREQGLLTSQDQADRTGAAYREAIKVIEQSIPTLEAFAREANNPEAAQNVAELRIEVARLTREAALLTDTFLRVRDAGRRGLEEGLADVLGSLGTDITSASEAGIALAQSIVSSMQQTIAEDLAQTITTTITDAMADIGNTAAGEFVKSFVKGAARFLESAMSTVFGGLGKLAGGALTGLLGGQADVKIPAVALTDVAQSQLDNVVTGAQDAAAAAALTGAGVSLTGAAASLGIAGGSLAAAAAALAGAAAAQAAAASIPRFAAGGVVPNIGRTDPVTIHAERGEFVHTVAAHRYYGSEVMHALNQRQFSPEMMRQMLSGSRPAQVAPSRTGRYAAGGPVTTVVRNIQSAGGPGAGGGGVGTVTGEIGVRVAAEPGAVIAGMTSKQGETAIVNVVRRNAGALRTILGVR